MMKPQEEEEEPHPPFVLGVDSELTPSASLEVRADSFPSSKPARLVRRAFVDVRYARFGCCSLLFLFVLLVFWLNIGAAGLLFGAVARASTTWQLNAGSSVVRTRVFFRDVHHEIQRESTACQLLPQNEQDLFFVATPQVRPNRIRV